MMEAKFTVPGEPKGKGRPRFSMRKTKDGRQFTTVRSPDETVVYENLIRLEYERQCPGVFFQKDVPVAMSIVAYYGIPKSVSKKKMAMMLSGELRPIKKCDADNLLKVVADSINRVAYHDDVQIVEASVSRFYGEVPRVEVSISEISNGGKEDAQ